MCLHVAADGVRVRSVKAWIDERMSCQNTQLVEMRTKKLLACRPDHKILQHQQNTFLKGGGSFRQWLRGIMATRCRVHCCRSQKRNKHLLGLHVVRSRSERPWLRFSNDVTITEHPRDEQLVEAVSGCWHPRSHAAVMTGQNWPGR